MGMVVVSCDRVSMCSGEEMRALRACAYESDKCRKPEKQRSHAMLLNTEKGPEEESRAVVI